MSFRYTRKQEWIVDYKLQTAAYSIAHDWMFPEMPPIEQCVLLIGVRPNPEYRIPPKCQIVVIGKDELEEYKDKWVDVLDGYYGSL